MSAIPPPLIAPNYCAASGCNDDTNASLPFLAPGVAGVIHIHLGGESPPRLADTGVEFPPELGCRRQQAAIIANILHVSSTHPDQAVELRRRAAIGEKKAEIARSMGVSRKTLYQYLQATA